MITEELKIKVKELFKGSNLNSNSIKQLLKKSEQIYEELNKEFNSNPKNIFLLES